VIRDAEFHPLTKETAELRFGPFMKGHRDALGAKLNAKQRAILQLALSFYTWRTLVLEGGLRSDVAIDAMIEAIVRA
jgi:hypothetical protein